MVQKTFRFSCGEWHEDIKADNIFEAMELFQMWKNAVLDVDYSSYSRFDEFENLCIDQLETTSLERETD